MNVSNRESLTEPICRYCGQARSIVSAYIFGSRAEDRAHRESDLDVGLLLEHSALGPAERFAARLHAAAELAAETGLPTDVVILNDAPPTLARHIVTRGLRAYCRDAETDHAFVRDTLLKAADLEPFLRRTRRLKLEALAR